MSDELDGEEDGDIVHAGDGDDRFRESRDGAVDKLFGDGGDDEMRIDRFPFGAEAGPDVLDGGTGIDEVTLTDVSMLFPPFEPSPRARVSLDDAASNDGFEGQPVTVVNVEDVFIDALGGSADVVRGSDAANAVTTGQGNDVVDGLAGTDVISLGDGDDALEARDGYADRISCGPGGDFGRGRPARRRQRLRKRGDDVRRARRHRRATGHRAAPAPPAASASAACATARRASAATRGSARGHDRPALHDHRAGHAAHAARRLAHPSGLRRGRGAGADAQRSDHPSRSGSGGGRRGPRADDTLAAAARRRAQRPADRFCEPAPRRRLQGEPPRDAARARRCRQPPHDIQVDPAAGEAVSVRGTAMRVLRQPRRTRGRALLTSLVALAVTLGTGAPPALADGSIEFFDNFDGTSALSFVAGDGDVNQIIATGSAGEVVIADVEPIDVAFSDFMCMGGGTNVVRCMGRAIFLTVDAGDGNDRIDLAGAFDREATAIGGTGRRRANGGRGPGRPVRRQSRLAELG